MGHDGDEEPQGPHHPHDPVSHRGEVRIPGGKGPFGQGPGDQHRDDDPAGIDLDFEPLELKEFHLTAEHFLPLFRKVF